MSLTPEARLGALEDSMNMLVAQMAGKASREESSSQILAVEAQVGEFRSRIDQMRDQIISISTRLRQVTARQA